MPTPDFILDLRRLVGTRQLWLSGATAVVHRPGPAGTEVLLVKRSDNGEWTPVSGIVDPGEHPAATAVREVAEETAVIAEVERLAWVVVTDVITYANGDQTRYLDHVLRCRWLSNEPTPADGEASETAFFALDALPPMSDEHLERIHTAMSSNVATRLD